MMLSPVFFKQFKDTADHILHVPGNFTCKVLEMTVVVDRNLSVEVVMDCLPQMLKKLKMHNEVFQNVRLNITYWEQDERMENKVCPMMAALMNDFYRDYRQEHARKNFGNLVTYLKLFHARSKLIIVLTDGEYQVPDPELVNQSMQPFLRKKMMLIKCTQTGNGYELTVHYRDSYL